MPLEINIQLLDEGPGKPNDLIDIDRIDAKRDLDFKIDTGACRMSGFAQAYRCGVVIAISQSESNVGRQWAFGEWLTPTSHGRQQTSAPVVPAAPWRHSSGLATHSASLAAVSQQSRHRL